MLSVYAVIKVAAVGVRVARGQAHFMIGYARHIFNS